jgi:hypothetical protein
MVRSTDACCVMGLKSTAQAAIFGLSCAALGAVVASFCWATVELDVAVSPRLVKTPKSSVARKQHHEKLHGEHANSTASVVSEVKLASSCCASPSDCPSSMHAETNACPQCALKQAKLACDGPFAVPFVPLHQRPDYRANSPDILKVQIERLATEAAPAEVLLLSDEYLIDEPNGQLKIGDSIKVQAGGLTMNEIAANIQQALDTPETKHHVDVSVVSQNSHVYYVITDGAKLGDAVARYPIVGNETALDALAKHGCLSQLAHHKVWIARPVSGNGPDTVIPVSWTWTSADTLTCTNPALKSGDRIFIATPGPSWMAFVERAAVLAKHLQAKRVAPSTPAESQAH